MTKRTLRAAIALALFGASTLSFGVFGCLPGRFPVCKVDDDCKEQATAKLCYDLRCVQCRVDDDCPDGYCERKLGECKVLDQPGKQRATPSASAGAAAPDASAAPVE